MPELRTRRLSVVAQDPGVRRGRRVLLARVVVPWEDLEPGPSGSRVHVVDYDASTRTMYEPVKLSADDVPAPSSAAVLRDPAFHACNVYGLAMGTLARFEFALGRRVSWCFSAHQLKVAPHAFEEVNAFYSREAEALLFGYYSGEDGRVFTCLSHDVVVHETTHALVDGLRRKFMAPSSPDQAAFHEGFADVIALLSVFSLGDVLRLLIDLDPAAARGPVGLVRREAVSMDRLMESVLFGLAEQMGPESGQARANALRRSVLIEPDPNALKLLEYQEAHRRGELLVAAMMHAFLEVWTTRLGSLGSTEGDFLDLGRVVEEGATVAAMLLTMSVRALDYTPPIHLEFGDFLSALLTADSEIRSDDSRYHLRDALVEWFGRYGIIPASETPDGLWERSDLQLVSEGVRFGSLQTEPIEMFRLIWANRNGLSLDPTAYTRVASVRPSIRASPDDGLPLRETVGECLQYVKIPAADLRLYGLVKPAEMPDETPVELEGGSTLILDDYGRLKYEIHNRLPSGKKDNVTARAQRRLDYLWQEGAFAKGASFAARLATIHRLRAGEPPLRREEAW